MSAQDPCTPFLSPSRRGFIHTDKQRLQGIASFKKEAREMLLISQLHDWLKCRAQRQFCHCSTRPMTRAYVDALRLTCPPAFLIETISASKTQACGAWPLARRSWLRLRDADITMARWQGCSASILKLAAICSSCRCSCSAPVKLPRCSRTLTCSANNMAWSRCQPRDTQDAAHAPAIARPHTAYRYLRPDAR